MQSPRNHVQHRQKGFRQFSAGVIVASLVWMMILWSDFEELFSDRSSREDSLNKPSNIHVDKREEVPPKSSKEGLSHERHQNTTTKAPNQPKGFSRVVILDERTFGGLGSFSSASPHPLPHEAIEKDPVLEDNQPRDWHVDQGNLEYYLMGQFTEDYQTHCVDMMEWQSKSYPVCNSIHELGIHGGSASAILHSRLNYLGRGSWRSAYSIRNQHAIMKSLDPRSVILKLFTLADDEQAPFDPRAYEMHRVDSVISQKLTSSPYVLDIYGHCGLTGMYEQAVTELDHEAKYRSYKKVTYPLFDATKAKYAAQVASALVDMHGVDYPKDRSNTTIVHADIKPENILLVRKPGGLVAKLGDFNNSILRKWNVTSQSPCPYYSNPAPHAWGAGFKAVEQSNGESLDESVDMFAFGGILYYILVGKEPYDEYPEGNETLAMASGELPPLPFPLKYGNASFYETVVRTANVSSSSKVVPWANDDEFSDDRDDAGKELQSYHQNTPYNGDPRVVQAILAGIEASMKVQPKDRATVEEVANIFRSYMDRPIPK